MDATREEIREDFLTCLICTEIYTDPCTLTCGHSFCKTCLTKYMKTQPDAIKNKTILCPYCRQVMAVPNSDGSVQDWIQSIEPSLVTKRLMDSYGAVGGIAEESFHRICFTCQQVGNTVQAAWFCQDCGISLCSVCTKMHAAVPVTSQHCMADLQSGDAPVLRRRVICKEHNTIVDFYCKDCNKSICHKCCILYHRKCECLFTAESMVPDMRRYLTNMQDIMTERMTEIKANSYMQQSIIDDVKSHRLHVVGRIQNTCDRVSALVKAKGKVLVEKVGVMTDKQIGQLKAGLKSEEIDLQMYQQYCEFISHSLTSDNTMDMCEMYQMFQSGSVAIRGINTSEFKLEEKLWFEEDKDYRDTVGGNPLGRLVVDAFYVDSTHALKETIDLRLDSDRRSELTSITALHVGGVTVIVVVDKENRCLKSTYTRDDETSYDTLRMSRKPISLGQGTDDESLVVCLTSNKGIAIIRLTPDMVLKSTTRTTKKYNSLTVLSKATLAAGREYPPIVDILDMDGVVQHSIKGLTAKPDLFKCPSFLATTADGNVLVSDSWSNSVYCITPEGDVVFTFNNGGDECFDPRGIACTPFGHAFIADWGNSQVLQLTGRGGVFSRAILTSTDGLDKPCGLCVVDDKLCITEGTCTVKVFGLN